MASTLPEVNNEAKIMAVCIRARALRSFGVHTEDSLAVLC